MVRHLQKSFPAPICITMSASPVSLCMVVKNEERNLPRCLESVEGVAGEIVVVDTGSTDHTVQIAESYGARVLAFDFSTPDFSAARNFGIARANKPWILVLDGDEALAAGDDARVLRFAELNENAGYYLERRNHFGDSCTTDFAVRLFPRRPEYRYRGRVHETVDASILENGGRLVRCGVRIEHRPVANPTDRARKSLWYLGILHEEIEANPADDSRLDFLAAEYHQMARFDAAAEVAEEIARRRPREPRAHLVAGIYHWVYQSDAERARADFRRALELRPDDREALEYLSQIDGTEARAAIA